jgi:hypothetical protein
MIASGPVRRCRPRLPTVRFSFHCGHHPALPQTAAAGQDETPAPQQTPLLFDNLIGGGEQT